MDKGWACSKCGCSHNYSTRSKCRWCGASCPSKSLRQQTNNSWYGKRYYGGHNQEYTGTGNNDTERGSTHEPKTDQQLVLLFKHEIKTISGMRKGGDFQGKLLEAKKEELNEVEMRIQNSKPQSQVLQKIEGKIRGAEKRLLDAEESILKKKEHLEQAKHDLNDATTQRDNIKDEITKYEEQKKELHSKVALEDDMADIDDDDEDSQNSTSRDPISALEKLFGGNLPDKYAGLKAEAEVKKQERLQTRQELDAK